MKKNDLKKGGIPSAIEISKIFLLLTPKMRGASA
jgi:hypothetical protein